MPFMAGSAVSMAWSRINSVGLVPVFFNGLATSSRAELKTKSLLKQEKYLFSFYVIVVVINDNS